MNFESDLNKLCQLAIQAAHRAGSIINEYRERNVAVEHKAVGNSEASQVVTEVDRKAQQAIIETLEPSLQQYDLALLAEESADDGMRLQKHAFWCIDPMDGTLAFVRNVAGFSVSIGLVAKNGEPLIGVVYDPIQQVTYHTYKGAGAFKNDNLITLPALNTGTPLTLVADISLKKHPNLPQTETLFQQIASKLGLPGANIEFRIGGVMNAIRALSQPNHCYFKPVRNDNNGGSLWDYAATACLFNEAGAIACDVYGNPLDLNRAESTFMNHRGVVYSSDKKISREIIDVHKKRIGTLN